MDRRILLLFALVSTAVGCSLRTYAINTVGDALEAGARADALARAARRGYGLIERVAIF